MTGGNTLTCPSDQSAQCCTFLIPISNNGNVIDIGLGCVNCKLVARHSNIFSDTSDPGGSCPHQAACCNNEVSSIALGVNN